MRRPSEATERLKSLLVPAASVLPSNAEYLAHLDVATSRSGLIRLASNENSDPPSPRVRQALERAYDDANRSPSPNPPLRRALAERFGVEPAGVLLGAGSTEVIDATLRTFVRAGDEVAVPAPTWPVFRRRLAALDARIVEVPLEADEERYAYDADALLSAVSERTKLIVLCSPNNPTGNSMRIDDARRLADTDIPLLVDAAYADFDPEIDLTPLVHEYANVVLSRTFSKAYCLAGLRVGYVVGNPELLDYVERFLVPGSSVSSAALAAGLAALEDDAYHDREVERIVAERERLRTGLRAAGAVAYESRGNFVALDASRYPNAAAGLTEALLAHNILVRPMTEAIVRITVGTAVENDAVLRAANAVLADHGGVG